MHVVGTGQVSSLNIVRLSRSGGRLTVPVRPAHTVYAQYRHISGAPASGGQRAVPLFRIRILNSLITNLSRIKNSPLHPDMISEGQDSEALIQKYAAELSRAIKTLPQAFGTLSASSGMIFNVSA